MHGRLLGAAVAALLAAATPAGAHPAYHFRGGCGWYTVSAQPEGPTWTGVVYADVVATDTAGTPAPLAPTSVTCRPYVNGDAQPVALTASGSGSAVGVAPWTVTLRETDVLWICAEVVVAGEQHERCPHAAA